MPRPRCLRCFKDVSYKTTYVFKPLEQEKSGDPTQILADAKLYAFAADTSSWEVASCKDALAGVISQRGNRNEKDLHAARRGRTL